MVISVDVQNQLTNGNWIEIQIFISVSLKSKYLIKLAMNCLLPSVSNQELTSYLIIKH